MPRPVVHARYGEPVLLRIANHLPSPATHTGFGMPQLITHLHNFHAATESDGGPWDWYNPGGFKDHHYTMARAGFSVPDTIPAQYRDASGGDVRETLTTLFFHYHRPDFTGAGVYKGVVGMYLCFDEQDTGDETTGWRLPSGEHDIPLVIADKRFSPSTGALTFDQFNTDGFSSCTSTSKQCDFDSGNGLPGSSSPAVRFRKNASVAPSGSYVSVELSLSLDRLITMRGRLRRL